MRLDQTPYANSGVHLGFLDRSQPIKPSVHLIILGSELEKRKITPENIYAPNNFKILGRLRSLFADEKFAEYIQTAIDQRSFDIHPVITRVFYESGRQARLLGIVVTDNLQQITHQKLQ